MALRGTLKDFGIADILQLVGHQGKSGVLTVRNADQRVDIVFAEGAIVRADSSSREKRDLLGRMLIRAEVLSEEQINRALDIQKRSNKRLGQILVEGGTLDRRVLATFTRLQTTETIYRLFFWASGSYEFAQSEITSEPEFEPIRAENILMEGFRQLDEWPAIRRKVTGYGLVFERCQELDPLLPATAIVGDELDLDGAFGELGDAMSIGARKNIGQNERIVFQLIAPDRDVQKIIDLSRIGEFDTCKALERLIDAGLIAARSESASRIPSADATIGGISARYRGRLVPAILRVGAASLIVAGVIVGLGRYGRDWPRALWPRAERGYTDVSLRSQIALGQMQKLEHALKIYEALKGEYPQSLDALAKEGLVEAKDLSFPWHEPYWYRREGGGYVLLRPIN